jgi:hypothetical protein
MEPSTRHALEECETLLRIIHQGDLQKPTWPESPAMRPRVVSTLQLVRAELAQEQRPSPGRRIQIAATARLARLLHGGTTRAW